MGCFSIECEAKYSGITIAEPERRQTVASLNRNPNREKIQILLKWTVLSGIGGTGVVSLLIINRMEPSTNSDNSGLFFLVVFGAGIGLVVGVCIGFLFVLLNKFLFEFHIAYRLNVFIASTISFLVGFLLYGWLIWISFSSFPLS